MGKQQDFVKIAITQLGKGPSTYRKWFYGSDLKGVPWCANFVSWVADQIGILGKIVTKEEGAGSFARNGVSKGYGKWYEGNTTPKTGDIILFCWNGKGSYSGQDKYYSDHVGIVEKVDGKTVHTIEGNANNTNDTSTVCRRTYTIGANANATVINGYFRPDWSKVDALSSTPITSAAADIYCRVQPVNGAWLPEVKNLTDYGGIIGRQIANVAIKVSKGSIKYRVHVRGKGWLPYVTGYDIKDYVNGYAGNGVAIDAIEIIYTPPSGSKQKAKYRVSPVKKGYYSYQTNAEKTNGQDGYAGVFGVPIDRIQINLA